MLTRRDFFKGVVACAGAVAAVGIPVVSEAALKLRVVGRNQLGLSLTEMVETTLRNRTTKLADTVMASNALLQRRE